MKNVIDTNVLVSLYFPDYDNSEKRIENPDEIVGKNSIVHGYVLIEFIDVVHKLVYKSKLHEVFEVNNWWKDHKKKTFMTAIKIIEPAIKSIVTTFDVDDEMRDTILYAISNTTWNFSKETVDWMLIANSKNYDHNLITFEKKLKNVFI